MKLSEELTARGFIQQFSGDSLEQILDGDKRTFYLGADPTADSLHLGNLVQYMLVRHIATAGHTPILLFGGGTGLIGDPRDTTERPLANQDDVHARAEKLRAQAEGLIGMSVQTVNNADWLGQLNFIEFMRDTGKYFTVNQMIKKEIIARRLTDESPVSYTEFAYAPMQAYDFWHLHKEHGCTLQTGGSDQWGNIISGVEFIRKKEGREVFALATPLIVDKATGRKFGKSEGNAIWLEASMTSPYKLYQFLLNQTDDEVEERLKIFTLLSLDNIATLMQEHAAAPHERAAQKALAYEVTKFVHGADDANSALAVTNVLFGGKEIEELTDTEVHTLKGEAPSLKVTEGSTLIDALIGSELASSKSDARKLIEAGGVSVSSVKITDPEYVFGLDDFVHNIALLRKGKKSLTVLTLA